MLAVPAGDVACCNVILTAPAATNWTAELGTGEGDCGASKQPVNSVRRAGAGLAALLAVALAALVL
jgi:hypothetical protein